MKHTTDCNRDHIENYDREVSEWITFLIICIIVGVYIFILYFLFFILHF